MVLTVERWGRQQLAVDVGALSVRRGETRGMRLIVSYISATEEVGRYVQDSAPELKLRPTYAGTRLTEQGGGGHAMAPGPAPILRSSLDDVAETHAWAPASLDFRAMAVIGEKNFSGGREKEHILESGGGGVALFDYDNDGIVDSFIVNSF